MLTLLAAVTLLSATYPNVSVGDVWLGESRYLFSAPDDPKETDLWVWREDWKVVSVVDGVVTLDCGKVLTENRTNGQLVPVLPDMKPLRWTEKWSVTGVEHIPPIEDPAEFRQWRMRAIPPIGTKWKWAADLKWPSAGAWTKPWTVGPATFKAVAGEKIRVEGSPTADGAFLGGFGEPSGIQAILSGIRDVHTAWPTSGQLSTKGVPLPGGDGSSYDLKLEWKTIKFEVKAKPGNR